MTRTLLIIGTYTEPLPHVPTAHAEGIYTYQFDPATGKISYLNVKAGIANPTYVTGDKSGRHVYAIKELEDGRANTCCAFDLNPDSGELRLINEEPTLGNASCFVTLDHSGKYALVANYTSGKTWVMLPRRADGGVQPVSDSAEHQGHGINAARQDKSHGHCVVISPDNTYVFVADLGIDQLVRYRLDTTKDKLIPSPEGNVHLEAGSGPRHFVFRPDGKFVYVVNELVGTVTALRYDSTSGMMHTIQTVSTLPEGHDGQRWTSAIRITPDGRNLYASNRGHDSIVMYAVDPQAGTLTTLGFQSTHGKIPRDFNIDPSGRWLLVANQATDTVVTFRINPTSGVLEETGNVAEVATPVSLAFVTV